MNEVIMILLLIFGLSVFPVGFFSAMYADTSSDFLDFVWEYLGLPKLHKPEYDGREYPLLYYFFCLPLCLAALIKLIPDKLFVSPVKSRILKRKKARWEAKQIYSVNEISAFLPGDHIILKTGKGLQLSKFSFHQLSDPGKNIYNWKEVKENSTYEHRKRMGEQDIKYAVFEKDADDFMAKVQNFNNEFEKQKKEILKQIKES